MEKLIFNFHLLSGGGPVPLLSRNTRIYIYTHNIKRPITPCRPALGIHFFITIPVVLYLAWPPCPVVRGDLYKNITYSAHTLEKHYVRVFAKFIPSPFFGRRINIAGTKVRINLNIIIHAVRTLHTFTNAVARGDPSSEKCPLQLRPTRPTSLTTSPYISLA